MIKRKKEQKSLSNLDQEYMSVLLDFCLSLNEENMSWGKK